MDADVDQRKDAVAKDKGVQWVVRGILGFCILCLCGPAALILGVPLVNGRMDETASGSWTTPATGIRTIDITVHLVDFDTSTERDDIGLRPATGGTVEVRWKVAGSDRKPVPAHGIDGDVLRITLRCRVSENCRVTMGIAVPEGIAVRGKIQGADVEARRLTNPLSFDIKDGGFTGEQLASASVSIDASNGIAASFRSVGTIRTITHGTYEVSLRLPRGRYAIDAKTNVLGGGGIEIARDIQHDPKAAGRVIARANHIQNSQGAEGGIWITVNDGRELNHDPNGTNGDDW